MLCQQRITGAKGGSLSVGCLPCLLIYSSIEILVIFQVESMFFCFHVCVHSLHLLCSFVDIHYCQNSIYPAEMPCTQGRLSQSPQSWFISLLPFFSSWTSLGVTSIISFLITRLMSHASLNLLGQHSLFYEFRPLCVTFKVLPGRLLPASTSASSLYPVIWPSQTNYGPPNVPFS